MSQSKVASFIRDTV